MSDTIIDRLHGAAFLGTANTQVFVILRDLKTGEKYRFTFGPSDVRPDGRVVCTGQMLITVARNRLAKQWGSIYDPVT